MKKERKNLHLIYFLTLNPPSRGGKRGVNPLKVKEKEKVKEKVKEKDKDN